MLILNLELCNFEQGTSPLELTAELKSWSYGRAKYTVLGTGYTLNRCQTEKKCGPGTPKKVFLGEVRFKLGSGGGCRCEYVEDAKRPMERCLGRKLHSARSSRGIINKLHS